MKSKVWGILIGALLVPSLSYSSTDMVVLRGFGSLSGVYSDSEMLGFRRDMTQEGKTRQFSLSQDSQLGLQSDIQFTDALKGSVQVVGKDRVNNSLDESITWANLSYDFNNSWNVRVGRIGSDITLIGDVGNIGYAYDWVRPPVEFYGTIPFYYFDGAEVLYRHFLSDGYLSAKVFYGRSGSTFNYKGTESEFDLIPYSGLAVRYETGGFTVRAAYAKTKVDSVNNEGLSLLSRFFAGNTYIPGSTDTLVQLDSGRSDIDYYATGFEYRNMGWKWLAEVSYLDTDLATILPSFSAYTGLLKRIDNVALYGIVAHTHTTRSPESASQQLPLAYRTAVQSVFNSTDFEQSTTSLGVRWDVMPNIALKGQWDHSWVAANKSVLWDGTDNSEDEQVNTFTLSMSFIF